MAAVQLIPAWIFLVFTAFIASIGFAAYQFERWKVSKLPSCNNCGKKGAFVFKHRRVDGGPDRRYGFNPVLCNAGGAMQC